MCADEKCIFTVPSTNIPCSAVVQGAELCVVAAEVEGSKGMRNIEPFIVRRVLSHSSRQTLLLLDEINAFGIVPKILSFVTN